MIEIPPPPVPELRPAINYAIAGGGLVVGALLILWGRAIGRPFLALLGGAGGVALGAHIAGRYELNPTISMTAGGVVCAGAALLLARLVWALLLSAGLVVAAVGVLMVLRLGAIDPSSPPTFEAFATFPEYLQAAAACAWEATAILWNHSPALLAGVCAPAALIPLVVFLIQPKAGRIVGSACVGAGLVVGGVALGLAQAGLPAAMQMWNHPLIPAIAVAVLAVAGIAYQTHRQIRSDRAEADAKGEGADVKPPPTGRGEK